MTIRALLFFFGFATLCRADLTLPGEGERLAHTFSVQVRFVTPQPYGVRRLPVPKTQPMPEFPRDMRLALVQGEAVVRFELDAGGQVKKCSIIRHSLKQFADAAIATAKTWTFSPAESHERVPVAFTLDYEILFLLAEEK